jgi:hypothetical protein
MANRNRKLKAVGLFTVGFLCGAILAGGLVAWLYFQMFKQLYYDGILSNANTAHMIRAGVQDELLKNIEDNIQGCVISADSMWSAFWYVQRYYQKFNLDVPDNIQPILNSLPPRPITSCELRNLQEGDVEPNKVEPITEPRPGR